MPDIVNDPFNPANLRLSQDFHADLGVKKKLLTVPVRKPDKTWFVRVHPDEDYRLPTYVIELKQEQETYLVTPALWPELAGESTFSPRLLITAVNRQGDLFLWPVRLPGKDGRNDRWSESAMEAVQLAQKSWVRVSANMSLGAYEVYEATAAVPEPKWPEETMADLLKIAFKGRLIESLDHAVLQQLRGES
jgi:hypothetical protein